MRLFACAGGTIVLPAPTLVLVDREDGGNLVVNPPREVWERGELTPDELIAWSFLVAATGAAMLSCLPQLTGGCINYWEAGNWALNDQAPPTGSKQAPIHRRVHLHLLGRSPNAHSPDWTWGEAPAFPRYSDRIQWAADHQRLTPTEVQRIVAETSAILRSKYGFTAADIGASAVCPSCAYPFVGEGARCPECGPDA